MAAEETDNSCPEPRSHLERERRIAELADRQHGVVAVWQLAALGFTGRQIRYRARVGRLHRVHRGVYTVGYRTLTPKGHRMAAVLAYGPNAVLSHRSAAAHWDIGPPSWKIDVTTPANHTAARGSAPIERLSTQTR